MKNIVYFPNLNGVRFIAAFMVILHHIESMKATFKWGITKENQTLFLFGKLGVILFFVLSGFLITYLLLQEQNKTGKIAINKFYLRRIFRIWPLYFLIIIMALFVISNFTFLNFKTSDYELFHQSFVAKILLFVFFLPNMVLARFGVMPYASQTWSIGVEEQFYLIWPWLIKLFKNKLLMVGIIFFGFHLVNFMLNRYESIIPYGKLWTYFFQFFNLDCMAIGAFFGIILFQNKVKLLQIIKHKIVFYLTLSICVLCIVFGYSFPFFNYQIYALLFGVIVLNLATSKPTFLEYKWINYLGKISYGLYMYHIIAIGICIACMDKIGLHTNLILYPFSIALTILLSAVSYKYFETYFLKLKTKFQ